MAAECSFEGHVAARLEGLGECKGVWGFSAEFWRKQVEPAAHAHQFLGSKCPINQTIAARRSPADDTL
jgi:hypothetical protein